MKYLLSLPVLIAAVAAQGNLSGCGQTCWNNMLDKASSLGCSPRDIKCLCGNPDFQNGLNDCSRQACGEAVRAAVVAYGRSQCGDQAAQGGIPIGGAAITTPTLATTTETTSEILSESTVTAVASNTTTTTTGTETSSTAVRTVSSTTATAGGVTTTGVNNPATSTNLAMKMAGPFAGAGALGLAVVFLPLV